MYNNERLLLWISKKNLEKLAQEWEIGASYLDENDIWNLSDAVEGNKCKTKNWL